MLGLIGPSRQGEVALLVHRVAGRYVGSGPSWHCDNSHRKASENCRGYSKEVVDWRVEAGGAEHQLRPGDQLRHSDPSGIACPGGDPGNLVSLQGPQPRNSSLQPQAGLWPLTGHGAQPPPGLALPSPL